MKISKNKINFSHRKGDSTLSKDILRQQAKEEKFQKFEQRLQEIENILTGQIKNKQETPKIKLTTAVLNTTLHGIPKIFNSDHIILRLIWAIMFITSAGSCSYLIAKNLIDYYSYPVISNIDKVYENKAEFPTIMVCFHRNISSCQFNNVECGVLLRREQVAGCQIFNYGANDSNHAIEKVKSVSPGTDFGLKLKIDLIPKTLTRILIFNHTYNEYKSFLISFGKVQEIVIKKKFQTKLSQPYSNCKDEVSLGDISLNDNDIIKKTSFQYIQSRCFEQCKYKNMFELCNKTEYFVNNLQYSYTNNILFYNNMVYGVSKCNQSLFIDIYIRGQSEGVNGICNDECPPECNSISYSLTFSETYSKSLFDQNQTELNVFYDDFYYTSINQQPKISDDGLVGTIGGLLGLFLGASLLTTVEFIDLVFNIIRLLL